MFLLVGIVQEKTLATLTIENNIMLMLRIILMMYVVSSCQL